MQGRGFCDLSAVYAENGIGIYGVSFDTPEENKAFADKFGFDYPLLSDSERVLALAFGAAENQKTAYASRVGVLLDETGGVIKHYPAASARTFPLDVLVDLGLEDQIS